MRQKPSPRDSQRTYELEPYRKLLRRQFEAAAPKSLSLCLISSLKDIALFVRDNERLFVALERFALYLYVLVPVALLLALTLPIMQDYSISLSVKRLDKDVLGEIETEQLRAGNYLAAHHVLVANLEQQIHTASTEPLTLAGTRGLLRKFASRTVTPSDVSMLSSIELTVLS